MANQYCDVAKKVLSGVASQSGPSPSTAAPRATRASTSGMKDGHTSLLDDTEFALIFLATIQTQTKAALMGMMM